MIKPIIIALRLIAAFVSNNDTNPNMIPVTCYGNSEAVPCAYTEVVVGSGVVGYYNEGNASEAGFYVCKTVGDECVETITPDDGPLYQAATLLCEQDEQGKYTECVKTARTVVKRIQNATIPD